MKNNVTNGLNNVFDIDTELVEEVISQSTAIEKPKENIEDVEDIEADYKHARDNLYSVIGKGTEALDYLLELAKASEHPRAFEVVSQLTKTLVDANKDLLDIQKKVKDLKKEDEKESPKSVTNALFVGSTAELQKLINGRDND